MFDATEVCAFFKALCNVEFKQVGNVALFPLYNAKQVRFRVGKTYISVTPLVGRVVLDTRANVVKLHSVGVKSVQVTVSCDDEFKHLFSTPQTVVHCGFEFVCRFKSSPFDATLKHLVNQTSGRLYIKSLKRTCESCRRKTAGRRCGDCKHGGML